ncbi:MAG TPA: ABC transporter permease [Longimicrobiales bacterium]
MSGISLRIAAALFGVLLHLLPRGLRRAYGAEMRAEFAGLAVARGAVWSTWSRCVLDLLSRLPAEWRQRGGEPVGRGRQAPVERMRTMWLELSQAARSLAKRPGFTIVTVLTLALGIGANVAIFAVVNAVLVKPLPYPDPDAIVVIRHHAPGLDFENLENSPGTLALYQEHARSFSALAGATETQRNLTGGREPARITVLEAAPSVFDVLRIRVTMGRPLVESDAAPGAAPVAVLTYRGWQSHFGGDADVLGRTILLNGTPTEVVGVLPEHFPAPDPEMALVLPMTTPAVPEFGSFGMAGLARLRPGIDLAAAERELKSLQPRMMEQYELPETFVQSTGWNVSLQTLRDRKVGDAASMIWIVFGTVSFLLLVACASVANLFLVRAESRQREVGIRLALGATRARVAATFLYESLLLGLAGGVWGLALGGIAVRVLVAAGPPQLPRLDEVTMDGTVILFGLVVSVIAGIAFGALPLLRRGAAALGILTGEARGSTAGRDRQYVRKALIVAQLALAIVLLTGSGLMLRSFQRLRAVDPGIRPEHVLTVGISVGEGVAKEHAAAIYQDVLDEVATLPGVREVGMTNALPLQPQGLNGSSYDIASKPRPEDEVETVGMYAVITDGLLDALGTPLIAGRDIERADAEHARPVMLINETFARLEFSDRDPIGQRFTFGGDSTWHEVVGVVRDVRVTGARDPVRPMAYLPMTTTVTGARTGLMHLAVRTEGDPMALAEPVVAAVRRAEPDVPLLSVRPMESVARESMAETSFTMTIILIAAVVALLLGAVGLYGVIGYVVSQRTREIGVRLALGALPQQVRRMVLRQGLDLAGIGTALGLAGAIALTRLLESVLFEVDSRDPLTFLVVPVVLIAVSALAAWLPARRASRVPPLHALREE